jgi:hypothetical protein
MLERPIHDLCVRADAAYRQAASFADSRKPTARGGTADGVGLHEIGVALKAALLESGDLHTFRSTMAKLTERHPDLAQSLDL